MGDIGLAVVGVVILVDDSSPSSFALFVSRAKGVDSDGWSNGAVRRCLGENCGLCT